MSRSLLKKLTNQRLGALLLLTLLTATTAWADTEVKYIDADGNEQSCTEFTNLTGNETSLSAGWYVVNSDISYTGTINLTGDVHLILKDGCTMNVGTSDVRILGEGINGFGSNIYTLDIYGQANGTGALSIYTGGSSSKGIFVKGLTINGGNVTANDSGGSSGAIISAQSKVTINGGTINAISSYYGISAVGGVIINGGTVNANGGDGKEGIRASSGNGTITLGWNKPADRICITANGYSGTVKVADGKAFTDGTIGYSGTIAAPSDINGKTLVPAFSVNFAGGIEHGTIAVNKDFVAADAEDKTVTLQVNPDAGYFIESLTATDANNNAVTITNNTFTMPASDVTLSATFTKTIASVIVGENETYYGSFSAAETAAKAAYVAAQGETAEVVPTLKLYDDINYGANSLQIGNGTDAFEMTLDLNGHRFYGKGAQVGNISSNLIYIAPKAKLTVVDTSTGENKGSIECTKGFQQCIINKGTLTLKDGIVKYSGKQGIVVCNDDGGLLTLDGATINGKPTSGNNSRGILNAYGSACNIVSGSIEDCDIAIQNEWGDVNMSDGVITNCRYGIDLNHSEANTLIISGGTISNCSEEGIKLGDKGNLNMTALPVFSDNTTDIKIRDQKKIIFGAGTYTAPTSPITVKVDYSGTDPYVFTEGYSPNVKDGNDVIAFSDVFNVTIQNQAENATLSFFGEAVIAGPKTFYFADSQVWSTWCDKYEWNIPEGIEVYEVTGVSNRNVGIQQLSATTIPAYKPVLLKKKDSGSLEAKATIAGVGAAPDNYDEDERVVTNTVGDATLVGTTQNADEWEMGGYYTYNKTYILYNNEFMLIYSNDGLAAHKFWINMDIDGAKDDDDKYCSRSLSIGGDGTTSLREVNSGEVNSEEWFSLDGRRLDSKPTKKGLYINNGKKIVIK